MILYYFSLVILLETILYPFLFPFRAPLIVQLVKNSPAVQETPGSWARRSTGEGTGYPLEYSWAFLVAQLLKNLPVAMWETWV